MTTERFQVADCEVELVVTGDGPRQVVFVHANPFQCWYEPLMPQLGDVSTLRYQRTIGGTGPFDLEDDADVVLAVLQRSGFDHAHVVGHSFGGLVALELARRAPAAVRSLALLEPASLGFLDEEQATAAYAPLAERARVDGPEAAMEDFLRLVLGDEGADLLAQHVADGPQQAAEHAAQFFRFEIPALIRWSYGAADASSVSQPVLIVVGDRSVPRFTSHAPVLQSWFAHAERFDLAGASHLLMAQQPTAMAERLSVFWTAVESGR